MVCLATAYLEHDGQREKVMQDVAYVVPGSSGLELAPFLGEGKLFQAKIKRIDLLNSVIILERIPDGSPQGGRDDQEDG
jgi:predicted RNA-binding protein